MTLTPAQLEHVLARTRRECEEQGLPFTVQDPSTLAKVARIVAGAARAKNSGSLPAGSDSRVAGGAAPATSKAVDRAS